MERLEKRPLTVKDARIILKERSDKFGKLVLEKMVELSIARKRAGTYHIRANRRAE